MRGGRGGRIDRDAESDDEGRCWRDECNELRAIAADLTWQEDDPA